VCVCVCVYVRVCVCACVCVCVCECGDRIVGSRQRRTLDCAYEQEQRDRYGHVVSSFRRSAECTTKTDRGTAPEPGEKQSCWLIQQGVVLSNSALGWFECGGRRANLWQAIRKTPGGAAPWQRSALPSTFVKRLALHGLLIPAC
jgi:hypothetical protein